MYKPRRHLSQMHTTNYMPFMREKAAYWKKSESLGEGAAAPPPFESATVSTFAAVGEID